MNPLRALIWVAVSTAPQANEDVKISLPSQEADARAVCTREGWQIVDVLKIPGHSRRYIDIHECAADMLKEGIDAFYRLMDLWESRGFDVLLVRDGDRFARTQTLHAYVTERTISIGARIFSLADGWVDEQNYRMWIAMGGYKAASGIDTLVKARRRAMDKFAERGLPTSSSVIISHKIIRDENGKMLRLEVDESKRRLWDDLAALVLEGVGWHRMESELYQRFGHVNGDGRPFTKTTMYHLLYHPTFWGNSARYFNSTKHGQGKGLWAFDPDEPAPDDALIFYDTHPAVYTAELAEKIKAELRRRRGIQGKTKPDESQRFTGLFVCAECGYTLVYTAKQEGKWPRSYLRCLTRYRPERGKCHQGRYLNERDAIDYIDNLLHDMRADGSPKIFMQSDHPDTHPNISQLQEEIAALETQIRRMILKQAQADDLADLYDREISAAGERLKILRSNLTRLQRETVSGSVKDSQQRSYEELVAMSLDAFWEKSPTYINQMLHRLMGNKRFLVKDGQIVGMADALRL